MDHDYHMIDNHIDEAMKKKILEFEYVDFSKLLPHNRSLHEDDQCLEIVNRNGMTFLSPVSDRDNVGIISFAKWDQAFRVYSSILTTRYPMKLPELLQYSHTIHMAATSYLWDNVYSYDKEFCHHISRYPTRAWNVILQQAWTILLKDRLKGDGGYFNNSKGGTGAGKGRKEPCK